MRGVIVLLVTALAPLVSRPVAAQTTGSTSVDSTLDRRRVIDSVAALVRSRYVSADTGAMIADRLVMRAGSGAYDAANTIRALEDAVTTDLRAINGDKHLSFRHVPTAPSGATSSASGPSLSPNFGVAAARVMDGNIGYLPIRSFVAPTPENLAALASAMDSLKNVRALIIDVRDNPGGNGAMNDYVWGYVVGPDSVKTMLALPRGAPQPFQRWTKPINFPRPRAGVPIFVLTSSHTGSAAEGFSFFLQQSGRARTVGETTAGAGHNVGFFGVAPGYNVGISIGRVMYAGNNREWERVGVRPDIPATADSALAVVLREASHAKSP
jgi:hypothetical protein